MTNANNLNLLSLATNRLSVNLEQRDKSNMAAPFMESTKGKQSLIWFLLSDSVKTSDICGRVTGVKYEDNSIL
jgi:hypothetical protein